MGKQIGFGGATFMIGIIGALTLGLLKGFVAFKPGVMMTSLLVIAGLIIGFVNVSTKNAVPVMVSALVLGSGAGVLASLPAVGATLSAMLSNLASVVLPAGIVIASKTIYEKAR